MHSLTYIPFLVIMNSTDVDSNLGPRKPTLSYETVVTREQRVACDDCQQ